MVVKMVSLLAVKKGTKLADKLIVMMVELMVEKMIATKVTAITVMKVVRMED